MESKSEYRAEIQKLLYHAFPSALDQHYDGWSVYVSSTEDVSGVVSIANRCGCPVALSTAAAEDTTGRHADSPVIRISMDRITEVTRINEQAMTAEVQAGVTVRDLEIVLNDHGMTSGFMLLPDLDPVLIEFLTNESLSESSMLYGRVDQAYIGAEGVLPSGEVFRIKPAPARAVGPDLLGLLVSENGKLSIVTSLILRIWKQAKSRRIIAATFEEIEGALRCASMIARSAIRLAGGRIYAPGRPDSSKNRRTADGNVAVFILEGEQAVVDSRAVHIDEIVQECGGSALPQQHHLATRFIRVPRILSGEESESVIVCAAADWSAALSVLREVSSRLEEQIKATRISDFFHEGCSISWTVRETDIDGEILFRVVEVLQRFGGSLISHHPGLDEALPAYFYYDGNMRKKIEELKQRIDPSEVFTAVQTL